MREEEDKFLAEENGEEGLINSLIYRAEVDDEEEDEGRR